MQTYSGDNVVNASGEQSILEGSDDNRVVGAVWVKDPDE